MTRRKHDDGYVSNFNNETVSNTYPEKIEKYWERAGYEAERQKDYRAMHAFFQQADHWKRVAKGEN